MYIGTERLEKCRVAKNFLESDKAVDWQEVEEVARHRRAVGTDGGRLLAATDTDDGIHAESDVEDDEDDVDENACDVQCQ